MHFDRRAVEADRLHFDLNDALKLEGFKQPLQNARLAPAVHADIDCVPLAVGFRQRPPFAAVFCDITENDYPIRSL